MVLSEMCQQIRGKLLLDEIEEIIKSDGISFYIRTKLNKILIQSCENKKDVKLLAEKWYNSLEDVRIFTGSEKMEAYKPTKNWDDFRSGSFGCVLMQKQGLLALKIQIVKDKKNPLNHIAEIVIFKQLDRHLRQQRIFVPKCIDGYILVTNKKEKNKGFFFEHVLKLCKRKVLDWGSTISVILMEMAIHGSTDQMIYLKKDFLGREKDRKRNFASFLLQMCYTLDVVRKEMGFIHNDIKPKNILLTESKEVWKANKYKLDLDKDGKYMLTDFGLTNANVYKPLNTTDQRLELVFNGTTAYMPPTFMLYFKSSDLKFSPGGDILNQNNMKIDASKDDWALALTCIQLLLAGTTDVELKMSKWLAKYKNEFEHIMILNPKNLSQYKYIGSEITTVWYSHQSLVHSGIVQTIQEEFYRVLNNTKAQSFFIATVSKMPEKITIFIGQYLLIRFFFCHENPNSSGLFLKEEDKGDMFKIIDGIFEKYKSDVDFLEIPLFETAKEIIKDKYSEEVYDALRSLANLDKRIQPEKNLLDRPQMKKLFQLFEYK